VITGFATAEGTAAYRAGLGAAAAPEHFRSWRGLTLSSVGIGTYLGAEDDATDRSYREAVTRAVAVGINVVDSAVNYRYQRSERAVGVALRDVIASGGVTRDQVVLATKGGFVPFDGAMPPNPGAYLAENSDIPVEQIQPVLAALARKEASILRPVEALEGERRYEIYHDALGPVILEWTRGHRDARRQAAAEEKIRLEAEEQVAAARRRTRQRAQRAVLSVGVLGGIALAVTAAVALQSAREASLSAERANVALATAQAAQEEADQLRDAALAFRPETTAAAKRSNRLD